jgi:hypothetical protein
MQLTFTQQLKNVYGQQCSVMENGDYDDGTKLNFSNAPAVI